MAFKDIITNMVRGSRSSQYARFLEGGTPVFSQFGNDIYASDIVQMCIDAIATECSKLRPRHVRADKDGMVINIKSSLNRLLNIAPNELMTTRDFLEKIIWQLYANYNAFIYPKYEVISDAKGNKSRNYTGFYPINPTLVEFLEDDNNSLFTRLTFAGGEQYILAYQDLIHLRKKFSVNEVMGGGLNGQPDNTALLKVLAINDTVLQGVGKAIKASLAVRGIIKINTMLDDDKQQAERARFEAAMTSSSSGILPLDMKGDFLPITLEPKLIDKDTLEFLQNKVLNYYGVSMPILSGDFTDEQYQAFYEKTLEPLIISLGQAFSKTLFTIRELDVGNEIAFYPQKLLFTNIKNKIAAADILGNRGALTNNMLLDMFGYEPYEGGNTRYMSLNYVDVNIANEYQMTRAKMALTVPQAAQEGEGVNEKNNGSESTD